MDLNFASTRGISLENIDEVNEVAQEGIEGSPSSRVSSSTTSGVGFGSLGSPRSWRGSVGSITNRGGMRRSNRHRSRSHINSQQSYLLPFNSTGDDAHSIPEYIEIGGNDGGGDDWEMSRADVNVPPNFTMADVDLSPTNLRKTMRDLITDSKYWISLVERLGYDRKVYDSETIPNLDILSRYYDSSDLGLLRVFHLFDTDKDRFMSKTEMIKGLSQQGFGTNPNKLILDQSIDELFELCVSEENANVINLLEFLHALKCLRLAAILYPFSLLTESRRNIVASREMDIHYHEYREDALTVNRPLKNPVDFLFKVEDIPPVGSTKSNRVQWIHCHEPSKRSILAIAVQFGLDPRYVLDVFTLWREQAKADQVRDMREILTLQQRNKTFNIRNDSYLGNHPADSIEWVFIVVPIIRLTQQSRDLLEPHFAWRRAQHIKKDKSIPPPEVFIDVETNNLAMFVTSENHRGTAITFTSEWCGLFRLDVKWHYEACAGNDVRSTASQENFPHHDSHVKRTSSVRRSKTESSFDDTFVIDIPENDDKGSVHSPVNFNAPADSDLDMFPKVLKVLDTSYSHLRTGDSLTLMLKTISDICEDYVRIIDAYEAALEVLDKKLTLEKDKLSEKDLMQIQRSNRHLSKLHRMVRPVTGILDILSLREHWAGESTLYLSDIKSNVTKLLSDSVALAETADELKQRYQKYGKASSRKVLTLLTLVTTTFVPILFVNGVYGMNFKNSSDASKSGMPELLWKQGYLFYWCIVLGIAATTLTVYRRKSLI